MPLEIRQLIREMSFANPLWGAPADSWRTSQARHRYRADERGQVHGTEETPTVAGLEDVSAQPCGTASPRWTRLWCRQSRSGFCTVCSSCAHDRRRHLWLGARHPITCRSQPEVYKETRTHLSLDKDAPSTRCRGRWSISPLAWADCIANIADQICDRQGPHLAINDTVSKSMEPFSASDKSAIVLRLCSSHQLMPACR